MNKNENKTYFCFIVGLLLFIFALVCSVIVRFSTRVCDKRTEKHAAGSEVAEELIKGTDERIRELEKQMQSARNETAKCIDELRESVTELGELASDCDRIAEAGKGIAVTADGIEERILRCLQVLGAPEEDEELLEGNGIGLYDPGGR